MGNFSIRSARPGSLPLTERSRHYAAVIEAALLLLVARLLVAGVPMRFWIGSLGSIASGVAPASIAPTRDAPIPHDLRRIVFAVNRATIRLPLACLPRAMAVQWMARRRGLECTLRIGGERGADPQFHAWVDRREAAIIGDLPDRSFMELLAIRSSPRISGGMTS